MKDNKLKEDIINALDDNLSIMDEYITGTGAATDKLYTLFTDVMSKFLTWATEHEAEYTNTGCVYLRTNKTVEYYSKEEAIKLFITHIYQQ